MKLSTRIFVSVFLTLSAIFVLWGLSFNWLMNDKLVDELDDQLEHYSEQLIRQVLQGHELPKDGDRSNNEFLLTQVSEEYLRGHRRIEYDNEDIFIEWIGEDEPARVMRTVFAKEDGSLWLLTVLTPSYERDELQSAIAWGCGLLLLAMMVCIGLVLILTFWHTMRPFYRLLHWLEDYRLGTESKPLDNPTDISEFRRLNSAATDCLERIESAYERERRFIGDASHELQTPLAICQNRIEMLMEDPTLTEPQMVELVKLQQTMSESIRLNKSLLLLSKIENKQFIDQTDVCVNDVVNRYAETYGEVFESMNVEIIREENATWHVQANESLMTTLVSNLLRNAYIHNVEGGQIRILLDEGLLSVSNTGSPEPLDERKLFQRFYRRDRSKKGSSGLGLSIVKAICDVSGFHVEYQFAEGYHTFTVHS